MSSREQNAQRLVRSKLDAIGLAAFFQKISGLHPTEQITFLCIGTDRSTGDSLGPLTGSKLVEYGFPNVVGTLPLPCDAHTLAERSAAIPSDHIVIAIDACLGPAGAVGGFFVYEEPLLPARSVGLSLPAVGNYSIAGVVDANGPKPYRTLQTTPLYRVMCMADSIAAAAAEAFGR